MRGYALLVLGILLLSIPIQIALAHDEDHTGGEGEFGLHARPHMLTVHRGGTVSSNITLKMEEDPPGQAQLTLSWDRHTPLDVSYSFNPTTIGSGQTSTLTFVTHDDSSIGVFHFHVWATLANEKESVHMALKIKQGHANPNCGDEDQCVSDFTIAADPLLLTAMQGKSATSMIIVSSLHGFDSPVSLSLEWETAPTGVTTDLQPMSVTPTATSTLTLTTSANTPVGVYGFEVIGISIGIEHESPDMLLNVTSTLGNPPPPPPSKDFTLTATPESWTINATQEADFNVLLSPVNGFSQAVSLSVSPSSLTGATITLTQSSATPPSTLQLKISTTSSITAGAYAFTVTGTNGTLMHHSTVYLIVLTPPSPPTPPAVVLTLSLSKYTITLGDTVTLSGYMTPQKDFHGTNLVLYDANATAGVPSWVVVGSTQTNNTADYSYDWTPSQTGTYAIQTRWSGNSTNRGAYSNLAFLQINPGNNIVQPSPAFPWFWLAIAAVIIIGVATAVALRIRRKPAMPGPTAPGPTASTQLLSVM